MKLFTYFEQVSLLFTSIIWHADMIFFTMKAYSYMGSYMFGVINRAKRSKLYFDWLPTYAHFDRKCNRDCIVKVIIYEPIS